MWQTIQLAINNDMWNETENVAHKYINVLIT